MTTRSSRQAVDPETPRCEENGRRGARCPNRARFQIKTTGWTMKMCGTHAKPWRFAYPGNAYYEREARAEVTPL